MNVAEYDDIIQLNSFLRGELSAVFTYQQCLEKIEDERVAAQLKVLQASHGHRARSLQLRIKNLGGEPAEDAGMWGGLAMMLEGGATLFGEKAALRILQEGEEHGLSDYRRDVNKLSPLQRSFVQAEILPEQFRTREILASIDHTYI
jgi:demethoxyubiquinone hydroxylase (CLK1/Coq7/Cat5 family)